MGRPFWKIWKAPNLHARSIRFRKLIAYIVTNRSMDEYLNICIYFNFGELKKKMTKNEKNVGEFGLNVFF